MGLFFIPFNIQRHFFKQISIKPYQENGEGILKKKKWIAAGIASKGVKLMKAARGGRTVYRAVSKVELRDITKYGFRLNSNYNTGKLFAETAEDASKFGKGFYKSFDKEPFFVV